MSKGTILGAAVIGCLALLTPATHAQQAKGKKYTLIIGINNYDQPGLPALKHAENDAEELAKVLKESGCEVVTLTTKRGQKNADAKPTAKSIREQLKVLSEKLTKHDVLLIAFSGIGKQMPVRHNGKDVSVGFLCPSDAAPRPGLTLADARQSMIPLDEVFKEMGESAAGVRLLLVDAPGTGGRDALDVANLPRLSRGSAAFFSCQPGERPWWSEKLGKGHGVFFHWIIQALKGGARNDKGAVTWAALAEYVKRRVADGVPKLIGGGAQQTPHEITNLEGGSPILVQEKQK